MERITGNEAPIGCSGRKGAIIAVAGEDPSMVSNLPYAIKDVVMGVVDMGNLLLKK